MGNEKRGGFTGSLGFVLAAAGSAVGLGNLWRFPYLAAKNGGGVFLLVYIALALTFGFALMSTEIALGRRTGKSPIGAYKIADKRFGWLGYVILLVPVLIFPYYCVIGGWVTKYAVTYISGNGFRAVDATGGFFNEVIGAGADGAFQIEPIAWFLIFIIATAVFVYLGVDKGIEKCSRVLMPILLIIILFIAGYSLTLKNPVSGATAIDGLKIYLIPDFSGMTLTKFLQVVLDAIGQLFYSMSIAMGIMITYGSYTPKKSNLVKSVNQIEIFDTGIALLAGLIMVPVVYCFLGTAGLEKAGPSLMFIALPQVFDAMGWFGNVIGGLFFVLVIFAAITSSISLLEAISSMIMDRFNMARWKATTLVLVASLVIGILIALGYNLLYFEVTLPTGVKGQQLLDVVDWFANNFLMPLVAVATCIVFGWFVGTKYITDEITRNNEHFARKRLYEVMTKYICPILLIIIFLNGFGIFSKLFGE